MSAFSVSIENVLTGEVLTQVRLSPTSTVGDLRAIAERNIERRLQFVAGDVVLSDDGKTIVEYGVESSARIMAKIIGPKIKPLVLRTRVVKDGPCQPEADGKGVVELKADGSIAVWGYQENYTDAIKEQVAEGVQSVTGTRGAVAVLKFGGGVVAWGDASYGGDCRVVQDQLASDVMEILTADRAFAAWKTSGGVVCWGAKPRLDYDSTLDTTLIKDHLADGVEQLFATSDQFIGFKGDGSIVQWGCGSHGSFKDSWFGEELDEKVKEQLAAGVRSVHAFHGRSEGYFGALTKSGSVVTWCPHKQWLSADKVSPLQSSSVGDENIAKAQLATGVKELISGPWNSTAALKEDGSVVFWNVFFEDKLEVVDGDGGVETLCANNVGWSALKADRSVVTCGFGEPGTTGDTPTMNQTLTPEVVEGIKSGVKSIHSTDSAFAALREDGAVVTWGFKDYGGDHSSLCPWWKFGFGQDPLSSGVRTIASTQYAFAALIEDGSVLCWGAVTDDPCAKPIDTGLVDQQLASGVRFICSSNRAFAAVKEDHAIVLWGDTEEFGLATAEAERFLQQDFQQEDTVTIKDPL